MTYSWKSISPYFKKEEIFSPETKDFIHLIDIPSLIKLNEFRRLLDAKLWVNFNGHNLRGVRSPWEQVSLKGHNPNAGSTSLHVQGKAFDITAPEMRLEELYKKAVAYGWGGVGYYDTFIHVDDRTIFEDGPIAIWDYRTKK